MHLRADIVCAYNYSVCLLHKRRDMLKYFKRVRSSMNSEHSLFFLDVGGGFESQKVTKYQKDYGSFIYEFVHTAYDPVSNLLNANLTFRFVVIVTALYPPTIFAHFFP